MKVNNFSYNEQICLRQIALEDTSAFTRMHDRYRDKVFRYALYFTTCPELAADITQEVFIRLWERRQRLGFIEHFPSYLFKATRNQCLNILLKIKRVQQRRSGYSAYCTDHLTEVEEKLLAKEIKSMWMAAVERLPIRQKKVYTLLESGCRYKDIAVHLGVTCNTVREQKRQSNTKVRSVVAGRLNMNNSGRHLAA